MASENLIYPVLMVLAYVGLFFLTTRIPGFGVKRGLSIGGYITSIAGLLILQHTGVLSSLTIEMNFIYIFVILISVLSASIGVFYPQIYLGALRGLIRFITELGILFGVMSILIVTLLLMVI